MLFDTGAMKSVMSLEMYEKLKLKDLNTTSIPHVVGASGKSLGARGRTKCEVNINGKIFYQTFIVCEHLKRPIILGRDFSIQNCIGISWTKTNTCQLTQNNEVIAETAEYQTPSRASVLHGLFQVYLQIRSESSEGFTYSWRSHATLPSQPVNRAVQYLRRLSQDPPYTLKL